MVQNNLSDKPSLPLSSMIREFNKLTQLLITNDVVFAKNRTDSGSILNDYPFVFGTAFGNTVPRICIPKEQTSFLMIVYGHRITKDIARKNCYWLDQYIFIECFEEDKNQ